MSKTSMSFVKNFSVGVSIGDTLDSFKDSFSYDTDPVVTETCWGNPIITEDLIKAYLSEGFQIIRIPVTWRRNIGPAPEYTIQPAWLRRVKEVVDYAYNNGAYVILNTHHEDWNYPYFDNQALACDKMKKIWSQLADTFRDYDEHLIFEGQNEPRKIGTPVEWNGGDEEGWKVVNETNRAFVSAVRSAGGHNKTRYLMLPCYAANCTVGIRHMQLPDDERLIVSVHAYEPYEFALEIPGRSKWNNDTQKIDSLMEDLRSLFLDKNIPVILGEFGAMNKNDNQRERADWAEYYVRKATQIGVPCIWWDNGRFEGNGELFGLLNRYSYESTFPMVLNAIMKGSNK